MNKEEIENNILISVFKEGWMDECDQKSTKKFKNLLHQKAYNTGREFFILGDDSSYWDNLTTEQILHYIKNE